MIELVPVLLFEGPLDNEIVWLPPEEVLTGHMIYKKQLDDEPLDVDTDYELGQLYYHDFGKMHVTWVGRPAGTKPTIKLALDVAVMLMKLLRR